MGWASGSMLVAQMVSGIKDLVDDKDTRKDVYMVMIEAATDFDCDTLDECLGIDPAFDDALYEVFPDWKDVDEEDEDDEL